MLYITIQCQILHTGKLRQTKPKQTIIVYKYLIFFAEQYKAWCQR